MDLDTFYLADISDSLNEIASGLGPGYRPSEEQRKRDEKNFYLFWSIAGVIIFGIAVTIISAV